MPHDIVPRRLRGRGGGGKGGGGAFAGGTEADNTLFSRSVARSIEVVSEGQIGGLVSGLQSIFLNDVALQNADGSFNFENVSVQFRDGTPDQEPVPGFPLVETEFGVGVDVTHDTPVIRTITDPSVNAVRVTIRVNEFFKINKTNGNIEPTELAFWIDIQGSDGIWSAGSGNKLWVQTTDLPSEETDGIEVDIYQSYTPSTAAGPNMTSSVNRVIYAQYRKVGASTWIDFAPAETVRLTAKTYGEIHHSGGGGGGDTETVYKWRGASASRTLRVTGLALGHYEVQAVSGTFRTITYHGYDTLKIVGKTNAPYEESYRIELPAGLAPWNIRLRRDTPDDDTLDVRRTLIWSRYTELIEANMGYDDSAYFSIAADAKSFGGSVPRRAFEIFGILIQIPSNYDPVERTYTGIWDGTFVRAWSNNPAWIFYDLLTNTRYGVGKYIGTVQIDKFALYEIAKYCDELVPDGLGNLEPRFVFNGVINSRAEAFQVLSLLAGSFHSMVYWASGTVVAVQDRPKEPVKIVTPANVIDGFINYSSASLKEQHTVALVSWNNPNDGYKLDVAIVEEPNEIRKYGWRELNVTLMGCTSLGQAIRAGRWALDTEKSETEAASWQSYLDQADAMPGEIVHLMDPSYEGARFGGRLIGVPAANQVVLDAPVTLTATVEYTLMVLLTDGTIFNTILTLDPPPDVTTFEQQTFTVVPSFDVDNLPEVGTIWAITSDEAAPRPFRIISVAETEKTKFTVNAILYDGTKFDRIDRELFLTPPDFSYIPTGAILPPTNFIANEYNYTVGTEYLSGISISWMPPANDSRAVSYQLEISTPGNPSYSSLSKTQDLFYDYKPAETGVYSFRVAAMDIFGRTSAWLYLSNLEVHGYNLNVPDVENFRIQVLDRMTSLTWDLITDYPVGWYQIRYNSDLVSPSWNESFTVIDQVPPTVNFVQIASAIGSFLIKAYSLDGTNQSINAKIVQNRSQSLLELNVVETLIEDPTFSGTKDDIEYDATLGGIRLEATVDGSGIYHTASEGYYYFHDRIDLGAVFTSRVSGTTEGYAVSLNNNVDLFANVDLVPNWDGGTLPDWDMIVEIRTTDDDPTASPTWSAWTTLRLGDYTARALEFRAHLFAPEDGATPVITALRVTVDMPDRIVSGVDVAAPSTGLRVDIIPPYISLKGSAIDIQNSLQGDYYVITSKDETGFNIQFHNAAGTAVARIFDWMTKGYGVNLS